MEKNILVVTGTRAEYGLLRSTMDAIAAHPELSLKVLVTGMHTLKPYGNTQEEVIGDGYNVTCVVEITEAGDMVQSLAQEIEGIGRYMQGDRPDCVLVLGDRDEPFAAAIVAVHLHVPVAHIHGGDVTGPGVDESIRHAITKLAHLHFPGTQQSAQRIRALSENPSRIFEVGTVVLDILEHDSLMQRESVATELKLNPALPWLTVLQHPTAFDLIPLEEQITATLHALECFPEHEKIIIYPNSETGSDIFLTAINGMTDDRCHRFPSLPRRVAMSAVKESDALVGNSSAGIIETAFLGTPTIDIGNRQRGRERGASVIHVDYDAQAISDAVAHAIDLKRQRGGAPFPSPYGSPGAGARIADVLAHQLSRPDLLEKRFAD